MADPDHQGSVASIPGTALRALHRALSHEAGPEAAARGLQTAGAATGTLLFDALTSPEAADIGVEHLRQMSVDEFWDDISEFLADLGWGTLQHETIHPGVGALSALDWIEADSGLAAPGPRCFVATGLISGLLEGIAAQAVAVLEVDCRSAGDDRCRFLFGGEPALGRVRTSLESGRDLAGTLELLS